MATLKLEQEGSVCFDFLGYYVVRTSQLKFKLGTLSLSHSTDYHYLSVKEKGSKSSEDQVNGLNMSMLVKCVLISTCMSG